jgi:hypothetical protein
MKFWDEQKKLEQQKYSDEEEDGSPSKSYGHTVRALCVCVCFVDSLTFRFIFRIQTRAINQ